jgi:hypothetical protein
MMLWAVPAAIGPDKDKRDIAAATGPGSLVERVILAGKKV